MATVLAFFTSLGLLAALVPGDDSGSGRVHSASTPSAEVRAEQPIGREGAPTLRGFGLNVRQWPKFRKPAPGYVAPCCWGPLVATPDGTKLPAWGAAIFTDDGLPYTYTRTFPPRFTEAKALQVLAGDDYPSDARLLETLKRPTCKLFLYRSPQLDRTYSAPLQTMVVALYTGFGKEVYTPKTVLQAILTVGKNADVAHGC